ncbi:MAG: metallopeptidase family protein, partial [Thermomicrobium sp.]|nr:metallopeptidase family protein [Thermomicrobium sp.]
MPVHLSRRAFEALVAEVLDTLPEPFRSALDNVAVVVEQEPRVRHRRVAGMRGGTLFGLYEGVPLTERTSGYGLVPPD